MTMAGPPLPGAAASGDPYDVLGVPRTATPRQVKLAYRRLSLLHHPDRQRRAGNTSDGGGGECSRDDVGGPPASSDQFARVAQAYSILGDADRRREYDRLHRLGAFDGPADGGGGKGAVPDERYDTSYRPTYAYAEDYSGGYYREGYVPPPDAPGQNGGGYGGVRFDFGGGPPPPGAFTGASAQAARDVFRNMNSADSFFDDLLYSPRSAPSVAGPDGGGAGAGTPGGPAVDKPGGAAKARPRPGIGFSLAPLGKHLSVHVPSRNEVMTSMISGGDVHPGAHLFGTRVTFSEHRSVDDAGCLADGVRDLGCGAGCGAAVDGGADGGAGTGSGNADGGGGGPAAVPGRSPGRPRDPRPLRTIVSTTTRIARGQRRIVTRTARIHRDGSREILIEEGGEVVRRYVEPAPGGDGADGDDREGDREGGGGAVGGHGGFSVMGAIRQCFSPCAAIES